MCHVIHNLHCFGALGHALYLAHGYRPAPEAGKGRCTALPMAAGLQGQYMKVDTKETEDSEKVIAKKSRKAEQRNKILYTYILTYLPNDSMEKALFCLIAYLLSSGTT